MPDMAQKRNSAAWVPLLSPRDTKLPFDSDTFLSASTLSRPRVLEGSAAGPNRGPEAMGDGSGAGCDWALLNCRLNTASGATWVSIHHGGGVGMGYSQHAGVVIVADGTPEAARRLERVRWNDPASVVWRIADAGYSEVSFVVLPQYPDAVDDWARVMEAARV